MAKKRILVLCGSGIASSTVAGQKVAKGCKDRGIDVEVKCISFREIKGEVMEADLVVSITPGFKHGSVPVVNGVAFLTGVGEQAVLEEVANLLRGEK